MTWRGSTTALDRLYASLPYALPLIEGLGFGMLLITTFPFLGVILLPLMPFMQAYALLGAVFGGFASLVIFFALYLLVVRNEKISHFIRFNTMQALLIGIAATLLSYVLNLLGLTQGLVASNAPPLPLTILYSVIFAGILVSCIFSIAQAVMGRYAEIPYISEAAYAQTRY
jgi:uncharacterized membrane protein